MTVDAIPSVVVYRITDSAIGTEYAVTFPFLYPEYVKAYIVQYDGTNHDTTELINGVDYEVTAQVFTSLREFPTDKDPRLAIYRETSLTQNTLWVDGQMVYAPAIMDADDKLTHIVQELTEQVNRAVRTSFTDDEPPVTTHELLDTVNQIAERAEEAVTAAEQAARDAEDARDKAAQAAETAEERAGEIHDLSIAVDDLPYGEIGYGNYNPSSGMLTLSVPRGRQGEEGAEGPPGVQGAPGRDGRDGIDGALGPEGPPGTITGELDTIAFGNFFIDSAGFLQFSYVGRGDVPDVAINERGRIILTLS